MSKIDLSTLGNVTLDINTLTLGEAAAAEMASGMPLKQLLRSPSAQRMLAIFVHVLRSSGEPPSWSEVSALRILALPSSTSGSRSQDRASAKSKG